MGSPLGRTHMLTTILDDSFITKINRFFEIQG